MCYRQSPKLTLTTTQSWGRGIPPGVLGCCGEASRATTMNNLTASWSRAMRTSNKARCHTHNNDRTLNLSIVL